MRITRLLDNAKLRNETHVRRAAAVACHTQPLDCCLPNRNKLTMNNAIRVSVLAIFVILGIHTANGGDASPLPRGLITGGKLATYDPAVPEELRVRDGLPNLFAKLEAGGPVVHCLPGRKHHRGQRLAAQDPGVVQDAVSQGGRDQDQCGHLRHGLGLRCLPDHR